MLNTNKLKTIVTLLFSSCAFSASAAAQEAASKAKDVRCSMEGRVLDSVTGAPLRRAALTLRRDGTALALSKAESDENGRFVFADLDAGRYTLFGERAGYTRQAYGARSNPNAGTTLVLAARQQIKDLVFKLSPGAIITGRILDEDGEPVPNAVVIASKTLYQKGEPQSMPLGSGSTNDLGDYRLAGLPAGSYTLAASSRILTTGLGGAVRAAADDAPERDYVTTYYPRGTDIAGAAPIPITAGAEVTNMNIRLAKAETVRVRGKVAGGVEGKQLLLMMVAKSGSGSAERLTSGRSTSAKPDGTFEVAGVMPGTYTLAAVGEDRDGGIMVIMKEILVGKQSLNGVQLAFSAPGKLSGSIKADSETPVDWKKIGVSLGGAKDSPTYTNPSAKPADSGEFVLNSVWPGRYQLKVSGTPENSFVKAIRFGDQDVSEDGFEVVAGSSGTLQIVLGLSGAQVEGVVQNEKDEAAADVTVVLIPKSGQGSHYQETRTDRDGKFTFQGIPPGDYQAMAFEDVDTKPYRDPEFLRKVEGKSEALSLREKERKTLVLKVIL